LQRTLRSNIEKKGSGADRPHADPSRTAPAAQIGRRMYKQMEGGASTDRLRRFTAQHHHPQSVQIVSRQIRVQAPNAVERS